jgi:shikimate dehydrogenase
MSVIRLALFGQPVSHSPSPRVHQAFAGQFGLEVDYRRIEASPEDFPASLEAFRAEGGSGCNITLPLKQLACELAAEHTARAKLANAANTLWWTDNGDCHADNTDGEGLVRDLEANLGVHIAGLNVLLLGAGGAAAGVLGALLARRPTQLALVNRTVNRARSLAARHAPLGDVRCLSLDDFERSEAPDLLIDATSMGHVGRQPEFPRHVLEGSPRCYSLNYGAAAQPFASLCRLAGLRFNDGLGMLVEQAALSFEIWTGHKPDTAPVLAELAQVTA